MPTTTNYGWTTPADTDLVKDGASAIRTLGTAIDTTVFNNASAAINKTIVDAKGDIIAATAADTVARLAVGANDTVLTADSSTATGLKWAAVAGGGQTLLSTTALTGASVTISGISTAYNDLYIYLDNPYVNAGIDISIQPNSTTGLADYRYMTWTSGGQGNFGVTAGNIAESTANFGTVSSPTRNNALLKIYNYKDTTYGKNFEMVYSTEAANTVVIHAGSIRTASAITELKITTSVPATRSFSGGQVRIYGVK